MAVQKIYEKRTIQAPIYQGGGEGQWISGYEDVEIQQQTGWKSDVSGQFYEYAPDRKTSNNKKSLDAYIYNIEQTIALDDTKYTNTKEIERLTAEQNTQRDYWRQQEEAQRAQFAADQAAAEKSAADQLTQFENERVSREQAKEKAALEKAEKLAGEQRITSKTLFEDITRMTNTRDQDLVASDDKKVLSAGDKETLFSAGQQSDDEKVKAKQTFLEKILTTAPTGTPKTK